MTRSTPIPNRQPAAAIASTRRWLCAGILLAVSTLVPACMTLEQIAPPVATLAVASNQTASLKQGRLIYLQACSRCHAAPHILKYTPAQWDTILPGMMDESDLTASHRGLVTEYINLVTRAASLQ